MTGMAFSTRWQRSSERWLPRSLAILTGLALCVWASPGVAQDPSFEFGAMGPSSLTGDAGSVLSYEVEGSLTTVGLPEGEPGAQGWSLSVAAEGGAIVGVSTVGTILDTKYQDGFEKTELTAGAGNEGAVSAVVLSLQDPITLDPIGTASIVKLTVEATVPDPVQNGDTGEDECDPLAVVVQYVDGRIGSGQPVENKVTYNGVSFRPTLGEATTSICPKIVKPLNFKATVVDPAAVVGDAVNGVAPITVDVPVGTAEQDVIAGMLLESNLPEPDPAPTPPNLGGAQGWSFSVVTDPCFQLVAGSVDIAGTATADEADGGYYNGGFRTSQIVDPTKNGGLEGVVSAVVLSFTAGNTLPPMGEELVLKFAGKLDASAITAPGETTEPCLLHVIPPGQDGLVGAGQPVKSAVTVDGVTRTPGVQDAEIQLVGALQARFVRGNANNDAKVDIADPIWIINELFRPGSPATACQDAADANNDSNIDVSDAVYLIEYLFQGGAMPPAPFPECGTDPEEDGDGVACDEGQTCA